MDRFCENMKFKNLLCSSITLATISLFSEFLFFKNELNKRQLKTKMKTSKMLETQTGTQTAHWFGRSISAGWEWGLWIMWLYSTELIGESSPQDNTQLKVLHRTQKGKKREPEVTRKISFPSKMDWKTLKKHFYLFKNMYKNKMARSFMIWPPLAISLGQTEVSTVDRRLLPASRHPASAGSVCSELRRATETFLCSCSLRGCWHDRQTDRHNITKIDLITALKPTVSPLFSVTLTLPFLHGPCDSVLGWHRLCLQQKTQNNQKHGH